MGDITFVILGDKAFTISLHLNKCAFLGFKLVLSSLCETVTPVHNQTKCTTLHKKFRVGHLIYIDTEQSSGTGIESYSP